MVTDGDGGVYVVKSVWYQLQIAIVQSAISDLQNSRLVRECLKVDKLKSPTLARHDISSHIMIVK